MGDESVLVVHNLSSDATAVTLPGDLAAYQTLLYSSDTGTHRDSNGLRLPARGTAVLSR